LTRSAALTGEKILVTGASGFIGSHLCRRLCEDGKQVHAISRKVQPSNERGPHWWQGDLADLSAVRGLLTDIQPDVVFHLAGYAFGSRELEAVLPAFRANLTTTVNVLTAATEMGCWRVVLAGSLEEPQPGDSEGVPASPYAASKWASSAYGRMFHALYQTPVVIARIFMVYGPGEYRLRKLVPYVIRTLLRGQDPKLSSGKRPIDWIYVDDVVDGLLALARAPRVEGSTIDLGSGNLVDIRTVVELLANLVDSAGKPLFGALPDRPMEQVRAADTAATYARTGWRAKTPLEDGLRRAVDWYAGQLRQDNGGPLL
jgi:UDP-glucose 4-epimerase